MLGADPIVIGDPAFFPLANQDLDQLDKELTEDSDRFKNDWFAYNGGSPSADNKDYKKPLFFDIALNYVQLDVDGLQERAGKKKSANTNINVPQQPVVLAPALVRAAEESAPADKRPIAAKAKEEIERPETPEQSVAPARGGGLSTLLGGWWGRQ
jgi:signal recognition particle subunit SRP68